MSSTSKRLVILPAGDNIGSPHFTLHLIALSLKKLLHRSIEVGFLDGLLGHGTDRTLLRTGITGASGEEGEATMPDFPLPVIRPLSSQEGNGDAEEVSQQHKVEAEDGEGTNGGENPEQRPQSHRGPSRHAGRQR